VGRELWIINGNMRTRMEERLVVLTPACEEIRPLFLQLDVHQPLHSANIHCHRCGLSNYNCFCAIQLPKGFSLVQDVLSMKMARKPRGYWELKP